MCHVPQGQSSANKYSFWQCHGEHTGFSSWLCPHGFPLMWVLSFATHLDPTVLSVVLVVVATELPTRWGLTVLVAVSA